MMSTSFKSDVDSRRKRQCTEEETSWAIITVKDDHGSNWAIGFNDNPWEYRWKRAPGVHKSKPGKGVKKLRPRDFITVIDDEDCVASVCVPPKRRCSTCYYLAGKRERPRRSFFLHNPREKS